MARWCGQRGLERGATMSLERCWRLARRWYAGRLELDWRRPPPERMRAIFAEVGLTGPFWELD